jgi:hypothetical protein
MDSKNPAPRSLSYEEIEAPDSLSYEEIEDDEQEQILGGTGAELIAWPWS